MATSRAKTIKLADLARTVDKAVAASAGRKIPGGIIIGRIMPPNLAGKIDANAVAREITKQAQASFPDTKLTPKVFTDGGITTMGFIYKPPVEF
jgi:hypothetical protein